MIREALAQTGVVEEDVVTIQYFDVILRNFLNIAIRLAGLAVFLMLIMGGFKYMTAGGDAKAAESARNTITYAILGLVLIIGAYVFLRLIKEFTGVDVTLFRFPSAP
ncbi:MAG: pilin [Candidatus Marinimicrobia bacterium]|nr:pilin [Candidatus Neomarinimicrobiota bacterium]